jgi:hypothetical protein
VRAAEGPGLIPAKVPRPYSHSAADTQSKYRTSEDLAEEAAHDPILVLEHELVKGGVITLEDVERIRDEAKTIVMAAAKQALAAERPDPASVLDHVYVRPPIPDEPEPDTDGEVVAFGEAIRRTLHESSVKTSRTRPRRSSTRSKARAVCSERPRACSARSESPAASTRRWPKRTSWDARSDKRYAGCVRVPKFSSSTTSGRP